jgi:hypothetical protein
LIEFIGKTHNIHAIHEIDKGITNVTFVLEVNGKIEEVIAPFVIDVNFLQQDPLGVPVLKPWGKYVSIESQHVFDWTTTQAGYISEVGRVR